MFVFVLRECHCFELPRCFEFVCSLSVDLEIAQWRFVLRASGNSASVKIDVMGRAQDKDPFDGGSVDAFVGVCCCRTGIGVSCVWADDRSASGNGERESLDRRTVVAD